VATARLELTREQILAYRRRVGGLDERLPPGPSSLGDRTGRRRDGGRVVATARRRGPDPGALGRLTGGVAGAAQTLPDRLDRLTSYLVLTKLRAMNAQMRLRSDERREAVIAAAIGEFAANGFAGTSTMSIAKRVGVSQPYLFQLYPTKKDLFIAAVRACFDDIRAIFEEAAREARKRSDDPMTLLMAMGQRYIDLLRDRDRAKLRLQLQAYSASADPEIGDVVRGEWTSLHDTVALVSGATEAQIHGWFAEGMLLTVAAAMGDLDRALELKIALKGATPGAPMPGAGAAPGGASSRS
jgi:AcrR family transcriptional regulator